MKLSDYLQELQLLMKIIPALFVNICIQTFLYYNLNVSAFYNLFFLIYFCSKMQPTLLTTFHKVQSLTFHFRALSSTLSLSLSLAPTLSLSLFCLLSAALFFLVEEHFEKRPAQVVNVNKQRRRLRQQQRYKNLCHFDKNLICGLYKRNEC